jgi:hypothetical protein
MNPPFKTPICKTPPDGWFCTRGEGHEGPCAAHVAVEVTVVDIINDGFGAEIPTDAVGFMGWFQAHIDSVPVEYRSAIKIEMRPRHVYEDAYVGVTITYIRPESDVERINREALEEKNEEAGLAHRRRIYESLKREFEG